MDVTSLLARAATIPGPVVVLTGAGISEESGIPTFRGPEGFWRVGSRNYRPQELATLAAFRRMPEQIWGWYLYRRSLCLAARPNAAHVALVELERALGDRFRLVTQNVDGLHLRAGSSPERTWQIHGNLHWSRCSQECDFDLHPVPEALARDWCRDRVLEAGEMQRLRCSRCASLMRPHVLWFDECYDEPRYRAESALQAAGDARLLIVIGTSGTTTLPLLMARTAARDGTPIIVVDVEDGTFSELALRSPGSAFLRGRAGDVVPRLVAQMLGS